jgi:5'-methylthioadenosine phosphorylase
VSFADPVCSEMAAVVVESGKELGITTKSGGTYLCMEGPAFSTRAESNIYRSWGMDVIGMTNLQEAKLAREAEICYVTIAMVTDYDCWHEGHDAVTVDQIIATLTQNAANACRLVRQVVGALPPRTCKCGSALRHAIITDRAAMPAGVLKKLELIVGKYTGR